MDVKSHLEDWVAYSRNSLRRSLDKKSFRKVEESWREQREYISTAVRALPSQCQQEAVIRLDELKPKPFINKGGRSQVSGERVQIGNCELSLDPIDGSICHLRKAGCRRLIADPTHRLACFGYQTFSALDYERYYRQYCTNDWGWAQRDFKKFGLPASALSGWHVPHLRRLVLKEGKLHAELEFGSEARRAGAPGKSVISIAPHEQGLSVELRWFDKPANRMPEAFWLKFSPRLRAGATVTFEKLGVSIDPKEVVRKGNRHLHAVTGPVRLGELSILSLDAALVAPGKPQLLDFNQKQSSYREGVSFNLYNNVWGTNFPMWYSEDALFRFDLTF